MLLQTTLHLSKLFFVKSGPIVRFTALPESSQPYPMKLSITNAVGDIHWHLFQVIGNANANKG
jgi:hypothetical protein